VQADASLYGVPYVGVGTPILDDAKQIIGAITISESTHRYDILKQASAQVGQNIESIAGTAEEISAQAQEMAAASKTLTATLTASQNRVKDTDQVLDKSRRSPCPTNLLGLNAPSRRPGVRPGPRLGVVAEEIRKLATSTANRSKTSRHDQSHPGRQRQHPATDGQIDDMIAQNSRRCRQVAACRPALDTTWRQPQRPR
jgi:hypothetical protein